MQYKIVIASISFFCVILALSCGKFEYPTGGIRPEPSDTTEIDTVAMPRNLRIDSLKVTYTEIIDSAGILIDSMTLGSFIALWDTARGADYYAVFVWYGNTSTVLTRYSDTNRIRIDSLPPNQVYTARVQAINLLSTGDTVTSDTSDTFAVAELYLPLSPTDVSVDYDNMTARVTWKPYTYSTVTGYRAYLRNHTGIIIDSSDVLDRAGNVTYFTVGRDSVYKVNVVTISTIGVSKVCSTFVYDLTAPQDTSFTLPYIYLSTFTAPDVDSSASIILGTGNMLGVTGGIFVMGDIWTAGTLGNGKPIHEVVVSSFYLSRSEISNALYVQFLNDCEDITYYIDTVYLLTTFLFNGDTLLDPCSYFVYDTATAMFAVSADTARYPVTGVTWIGAAAFCNWLSEKDYLTAWYDTTDWHFDTAANGYRLPTEAEYEYVHSAAFLGTRQRYPWGYTNAPDAYGSITTGLHPIGSFNAYFGFYDITGNALEWCHDWSDYPTAQDSSYYAQCLKNGVTYNPRGPQAGSSHVLRGGSYLVSGEMCSSAYRHVIPGSSHTGYGFRVARSHR